MDARIAARRRTVEAARTQVLLRRVLWLTAVVATVALAVWTIRTPMFSVRHLDVVGASNADISPGMGAAGIELGDPLLLTDLSAAAETIRLDPWVKHVELDRQFPDRLVVLVSERVEVAVLSSGLTVSGDGRVMRPHTGPDLPRIKLTGPPENSYLTGAEAAALEIVNSVAGITEVRESSLGLVAWMGTREVVFGEAADLSVKAAVVNLMTEEVGPGEVLDVSVPERPVVRAAVVAHS